MSSGPPSNMAQAGQNTVPTLHNHPCCWCGKFINGEAIVRWDPNQTPKTAIHPICVLAMYSQAIFAVSAEFAPMVLKAKVDGVSWREKEQG